MERYPGSRALALLTLALACTACTREVDEARDTSSTAEPPEGPGRPHVVIILADDLGYGDPRCYNPESRVDTPGMDRLAAEGALFTDAHSPSAVCSPTRYGVLTGRYCWRTPLSREVTSHFDPLLIEKDVLTLPQMLSRAGYATACIGKWHLGIGEQQPGDYSEPDREKRPRRTDYRKPLRPGPNACGFDYFFGSNGKPGLYVFDDEATPEQVLASWFIEDETLLVGDPDEWHQSEVGAILTARAVKWIEETHAAEPQRPLFLYFAPTAVHEPLHPARSLRGTSGAGKYGDFVAELDWSVREILAALERAGILDETLLFFTSDNGAARGTRKLIDSKGHHANRGLRGWKRDIWEGGHRVPLLVRWPGRVAAGVRSDQLVCLTDLMATVAAACGLELGPGEAVDSFDMGPALLGEPSGDPIRRDAVLHSSAGEFALHAGRWKYIDCPGPGTKPASERSDTPGRPPAQLYDLLVDPGEQHNLYAEQPEIAARMAARLRDLRAGTRTR